MRIQVIWLGFMISCAFLYNVIRLDNLSLGYVPFILDGLSPPSSVVYLSLPPKETETPHIYHWEWHPPRHERFPSVDKRVQVYMSNWYLPPCSNETKFLHTFKVPPNEQGFAVLEIQGKKFPPTNFTSHIASDLPVLLNRVAMMECVRFEKPTDWGKSLGRSHNLRYYTQDSFQLFDLVGNTVPVLAKFGDSRTIMKVPIFAKWRWLADEEALNDVTLSTCSGNRRSDLSINGVPNKSPAPIIWKLNQIRHWHPLQTTRTLDVPWEDKIPLAVWRGSYTGKCIRNGHIQNEDECLANPRCRFVYDHVHSTLVDAGFLSTTKIVELFDVAVRKDRLDMQALLKYKVIISLEGNDIASGLKWQLLSQSVVMMPPPTRTSWAMEELLIPWVHYVPIHLNGSNAEERVQWVLEHDEDARKIAERGSLFMHDLTLHPLASNEEMEVMTEMARRYRDLWH
jgi:hypothetical protein